MSSRTPSPTTGAPTAGPAAPAAQHDETAGTDERYLLEEDLVDEISIDGMCGVY
jgi:mycofactocin precursor